MHAAMVIAVGFALIILAGTLLLMLPCAAKSGRATPFIDALFTATSATCVTGLVTVGTAVHWSLFGKCVILLLIQIGGLGFMSVMTATSLLLRRTITLRERMVIGAGFGLDSSGGIVRLMRRVLVGTFLFERPCCPSASCSSSGRCAASVWAFSMRYRRSATADLTSWARRTIRSARSCTMRRTRS